MNTLTLLALCVGTLTGSVIGILLSIPICTRMTDRMWRKFDEAMRKQYPPSLTPPITVHNSPHSKELQDKFLRIGYGQWVPTPGVEDEEREIYLTVNGQHVHVMSVEEALSLSDEDLKQRMEAAMQGQQEAV